MGRQSAAPEHALLTAVCRVTFPQLKTGQSFILHSFSMTQRHFREDVE